MPARIVTAPSRGAMPPRRASRALRTPPLPEYLQRLFATDGPLSPHGLCLVYPEIIWTHVVSDAFIGLAYASIPLALASFLSQRKDITFGWMIWLFAGFILLCGLTHFLAIWTVWVPDYGIEAAVKALTAVFSIGVAFVLWPLIPRLIAIPSPDMLARANTDLAQRVEERDRAYAALERETGERLRAEEMLRQSQKLEAVGQLTGGIAHDFNNLLTIVNANLERARRMLAADPAQADVLIGRALQGSGRAGDLTAQLLAFARRSPLELQVQPLGPLVDHVAELARRTMHGVRLEVDVEPGLWAVEVDGAQVESAVLNLLVNARDSMPEGGVATIRGRNVAHNGRDHVELSISDTGEGMTEDVRTRAFEPFFTTKPVGKGTGLGLAQVYGFIAQSGGEVTIESAPGAGTSVIIRLPRAC